MTGYGYRAGGPLYWRVAAVDADRNQGAWTLPQRIALQPRMTLLVFGTARRGVRGKLTVSAYAAGQPLRRVLVRLSGPRIVPRAKRTAAYGRVTFTLRPRRSGKLLFTATKRGYQREFAALAIQ